GRGVCGANIAGQPLPFLAGEPVAGVLPQGEGQPAARLEPSTQPFSQPGELVQLALRDRGFFRDQEPSVAILVSIGLLLATPERGGAIGLAGPEGERRQAIG